ncbi:hypothetical protein [Fulvivirga ligni]|uniref:hypothetical protein n=1 Tax=Fulvivirga ligni TaxID=2904246 RepID=UPI001F3D76D0|nr:hypothetical protein [Fulvivirga ligni]UII21660.1 hypothetical protein LVD16_00205 [Fulvivirga ligni]
MKENIKSYIGKFGENMLIKFFLIERDNLNGVDYLDDDFEKFKHTGLFSRKKSTSEESYIAITPEGTELYNLLAGAWNRGEIYEKSGKINFAYVL